MKGDRKKTVKKEVLRIVHRAGNSLKKENREMALTRRVQNELIDLNRLIERFIDGKSEGE